MLNRLSIKLRVTISYSLLVVLICSVLVSIIAVGNKKITQKAAYQLLESEVTQKLNQLNQSSEITLRAENSYVSNGVYIQIYDKNGKMLAGELPTDFESRITPMGDNVIATRNENNKYMSHCDATDNGEYIVRGIVSKKNMHILETTVIKIALMMMPFIVLMAFVGGRMITRWVFRPLDKVNATVEQIAADNDLSKRIEVEGSLNDEVGTLGNNFNKMLERLEASFESEKRFISDASHELRTPVSVILAQCQWAKLKSKSEEDMQTLDSIERQAKRMSSLISRLLMLTRMDRGIEKLDVEPINISELLEGMCESFIDTEPEVEITMDIEPELYAYVNLECLSSAYENLINNAVRYGNGKVDISLSGTSDEIIFTVRDNGIGVPDSDIDKVWNRFYRGKNVPSHEGMGLGLAFVKGAAQLHGGKVGVQSRMGEGSTFSFIINRHYINKADE